MLLWNLPRLEGYTQRVCLGVHPVQDLMRFKMFSRAPKNLVQDVKVRLDPPALGGLTEVDPCTSQPSRIPTFGWLLCSVTRHHLPGLQEPICIMEGSSADQDEGSNGTPGFLGILPGLLPCNNPSTSRYTCTPRLLVYICVEEPSKLTGPWCSDHCC